MLARHAAPSDDGKTAAPVQTLARRAQGRSIWGVLRGDVDNFGLRLRRVHSIEEHVPALGALQAVLRRRAGSALLAAGVLAQGQHHLLGRRRFRGVRLVGRPDRAGARGAAPVPPLHRRKPEGISRARRARPSPWRLRWRRKRTTRWPRCTRRPGATWIWPSPPDKDCIYLLGRILEWRHLADAAELKDTVTRLIHDFRMSRQFLYQLRSFYRREAYGEAGSRHAAHLALPAPVQPDPERHARPRISEAAHAPDQRDGGT